MKDKYLVGIIGATGMVGQRFITLLDSHPWFEVVLLGASERSAGKSYEEAVGSRWCMDSDIPDNIKSMKVVSAKDIDAIKDVVEFVFCAVDMPKADIKALEEAYAKAEIPVVSNNSANRWTDDVPMVIPEINSEHVKIIDSQRKRLGTKRGFIATKPNCSIQAYMPFLAATRQFGIKEVVVSTYQAISGAGKTFETWPEMVDNVIPYIGGEEEKSEKEPLKIFAELSDDKILTASEPVISAQCIRVPVSNGHLASVSVKYKGSPSLEELVLAVKSFKGDIADYGLPSAPENFITFFEEDDRPMVKEDRMLYGGMGTSIGRLREDNIFDYKFVGLAHNTVRGAAGGAVLIAELLAYKGYLD